MTQLSIPRYKKVGARTRVKRLIEDRLAEKVKDVKEGQYYKSLYRKTGVVML